MDDRRRRERDAHAFVKLFPGLVCPNVNVNRRIARKKGEKEGARNAVISALRSVSGCMGNLAAAGKTRRSRLAALSTWKFSHLRSRYPPSIPRASRSSPSPLFQRSVTRSRSPRIEPTLPLRFVAIAANSRKYGCPNRSSRLLNAIHVLVARRRYASISCAIGLANLRRAFPRVRRTVARLTGCDAQHAEIAV